MTVTVKKILLASNRLPVCATERREFLDHYFDDLLASVVAVPDGWEIELNWPSTADYYVDPYLIQGLNWWLSDTAVGDIRKQVSDDYNCQISLNDSWTLFAWSQWLAARRKTENAAENVVILHVDDHTDLMTPRLVMTGYNWCDAITDEAFDLYNPASVRSAILSGAIGVGSFIAPFIHSVPQVELRHLSQTTTNNRLKFHSLVMEEIPDILLKTKSHRPAVKVDSADLARNYQTGHGTSKRYCLTHDVRSWLRNIPNAPILLHIDMDYFNNRFDGDSDWHSHTKRHDPSLSSILLSIDMLFDEIVASKIESQIENVTVALSPRFFPCEFWSESIVRIQLRLAALGWNLETPKNAAL